MCDNTTTTCHNMVTTCYNTVTTCYDTYNVVSVAKRSPNRFGLCSLYGETAQASGPRKTDRMPVSHSLSSLSQDGLFRFFLHPTIKYVGHVIHVRNQPRLRAVDGGQSQVRFKRGHVRVANATGSGHPT